MLSISMINLVNLLPLPHSQKNLLPNKLLSLLHLLAHLVLLLLVLFYVQVQLLPIHLLLQDVGHLSTHHLLQQLLLLPLYLLLP